MADLNIQRGPSSILFPNNDGIINSKLIIEEGCWYLCTDTAELFLGVQSEDGLTLKQINESTQGDAAIDPEALAALRTEINTIKASLTGYATKDELFSKDYNDLINKPELFSGSYNDLNDKPEIPEAYNDSELRTLINSKAASDHTHEEYALADHIHNEYLTEQSLNDYATKQDIADAITNHESLAKKEEVEEVKTKLETEITPTVEKVETEVIPIVQTLTKEKADDVPFTDSKIVGNSVGGFTTGEDLKGLTIAEILAKLLGLPVDEPGENPDEPEVPAEPGGVVEEIITNKLPMYSVNADGTITTEDFKIISFTEEESTAVPTESGFYQIINESGEVVESGYQDLMPLNDELYYVIALPKNVDYDTMVRIQVYDDEDGWSDCQKLPLTCDLDTVAELCNEVDIDISNIDTNLYTVWAMEDVCTGSKLRFIIEEVE